MIAKVDLRVEEGHGGWRMIGKDEGGERERDDPRRRDKEGEGCLRRM